MESGVATSTFLMANLMGISARIFEADESSLMIFVVGQLVGHDNGWTMVRVTVECSSLLETGVISGMVGFYPAWSVRKRFMLVALGVTAAFVANIIRLVVIIWTLHWFGKDSLFIAHTMVGRAVFFVLIIAVFWFIITLPTMRVVARKLQRDMAT
jgi:exosortase family protein XrtG